MKQRNFFQKNRIFWGIAAAWLVIMLLLAQAIPARAAEDVELTDQVGVTDLKVVSSGEGNSHWSMENGAIKWSGASGGGDGCPPAPYTPIKGVLVFTNNASEARILKFSYTLTANGGNVTDGTSSLADGTSEFEALIEAGKTCTITANTSGTSAETLSISISNIRLNVEDISVTFNPPDAAMGSYSLDGNAVTEAVVKTAPSTTVYKLSATAKENHVFTGWYVNGELASTADSWDGVFPKESTVIAGFAPDPLLEIASSITDGKTVDDLVAINSRYYHDSKQSFVNTKVSADGYFTYYTQTSPSGVVGACDTQYVPSLQWEKSDTESKISISTSGTATGEYETSSLTRKWCYANAVSNVIRIEAKQPCTIRFTYTNSGSGGTTTPALHYLESSNGSLAIANIAPGKTETDGTFEYVLGAGQYLYIYTGCHFESSSSPMRYSYSASISGFTVEETNEVRTQTTTIQDNAGNALPGGSITVNGTIYNANASGKPVDASGNAANLEFPAGQPMTVTVRTYPTNYVFLGWMINGNKNDLKNTLTYEYVLDDNTTVDPVFAPKQVIYNTGTQTYQYVNATGQTVDVNGQYIARNPASTKYYTTIQEGFDDGSNEVVLLGSLTINGDFEIPAGEVLIVPCSMAEVFLSNDEYTYAPMVDLGGGVYATLTLNGNMTVNGTLLVSGGQNASTGGPAGGYGVLTITGQNKVTVNKNAALYCYGLANGTGTIYALGDGTTGARIHELLEVKDMPHPIAMQGLIQQKDVMPFNTFFMNSIEAKTVYSPAATLDGHFAIRYDELTQAYMRLVGPDNSNFNLTSGTLTKYFDTTSGQIILLINENSVMDTSSFTMKLNIKLGTWVSAELDSSKLFMPLCSGWQIVVDGTLNINHTYKILPGAKFDVREKGVLNITSNGVLVFYRLNDYDYRRNVAGNNDLVGFTATGYPQNITRYSHFNIANVGSAKLNVDGVLNANGGLYVTEDPMAIVTETDSKLVHRNYAHYANGYNFLTGTGTINMGSRSSTLSSIMEYTANSQTTDPNTKDVRIVQMKGLPYDATRDGLAAPFDPDPNGSDPYGNGDYITLTGTVYGVEKTGTDVNGNANQTIYVWTSNPCEAGLHTDKNDSDLACDNCSAKLFKLLSMDAAADARTELILKFQVHSDLASKDKVVVSFEGKTSTEAEITVSDNIVTVTQPVASGLMTEPVVVSFNETSYVADKRATSISRSVVDYARAVLMMDYPTDTTSKGYSDLRKQKKLVANLVNYGGYAQTYFATNPEDVAPLADVVLASDLLNEPGINLLPEDRPSIGSVTTIDETPAIYTSLPEGMTSVTQNAILDAAIKEEVFFYLESKNIDTYIFKLTYTVDGKTHTRNVVPEEAADPDNPSANRYKITILNIPAAYLDYDYTITIDGSYVITPSITAYLQRLCNASSNQAQINLAKAMYLYNLAANELFGK